MTEEDKQTEEKIFESATEVFVEKGMDGARMQDIANRAGINKSLLHYYYRTKDHLFNAVFEMIAGQMFKKFAPVLDENLPLEEKIRFFFREHIAFMQKNPRLPSFILNELHRNPERIRKLIQNIDINKLWTTIEAQHKEELKRYNITKENIPQFMTTVAGMSVFPFVARPVIASIMEKMGYDFDNYLEERKEYAADFVINALKKQEASNKM
ncbi:MAG: TetR/AcrR family transcriptional regulator [Bacteroidia bacterium]|nr:TetR/AcrR family transcriptional regulator [Bacteroidia bacterium]